MALQTALCKNDNSFAPLPFCVEYEKTFYNMAICDKIPRNLLKRFFKECGHDPTDFMINEAYTNVFKGNYVHSKLHEYAHI